MIQRFYVHNFRCLENFELSIKEMPSGLLIGKNGTGKSTIAFALEILQNIGRGENRVGRLVQSKDFARGRSDVPIRFEIEVLLAERLYKYVLALELPEKFKELRVSEEQLIVAGNPIYSRQEAQVSLHTGPQKREAQFLVDWHLVALPLIQEQSETDPLHLFKTWLARTIILAPIPSLMTGESNGETLEPERDGSNFAEWFTGLLSRYPAAYTHSAKLNVYFRDLADGEKCFFLCAVVLAASKFYGPLFCFWDEPDNYLSLSEVGQFVTSLRRSFSGNSQIIVTSHNPEAIRRFSNENTLVLDRKSHLEPTTVRLLNDISITGDLVDALIRGDISNEPK